MQNPSSTSAPIDPELVVRQAEVLEQLRPVEQVVEAARLEVAKHRARCKAAEAEGSIEPERIQQAQAAAGGVDELIQRFEAMQAQVVGQSTLADRAIQEMRESLENMASQIKSVVERLERLN